MECDVTRLSSKYESNGDPGAIGYDAGGGWSYGAHQIASAVGSMEGYLDFIQSSYLDIYTVLMKAGGNSGAVAGLYSFKTAWVNLAKTQHDRFLNSQRDFLITKTYKVALNILTNAGIDLSKRGCAVQNALYSFAVMAGPGSATTNGRGACGLVYDAIQALGGVVLLVGYTDRSIIEQMYTCKLKRIDTRNEYAHASDSIRKSVRNRIVHERLNALAMLPPPAAA
jgi:hypothetical protein